MFDKIGKAPLPVWAKEWGMETWACFFLKFIVSNPHVTCTIPATRQVVHLHENMSAGLDPLPDETTRQKMLSYFRQKIN